MGTEAVHRALVRHAQNELGRDVGVPNDVRFEELRLAERRKARAALEEFVVG